MVTVTVTDSVEAILAERQKSHGSFPTHAEVAQNLKDICRYHDGWKKLNPHQREALEMICHKIGRILNGNPHYADHWADVAGYATLVANGLSSDSS